MLGNCTVVRDMGSGHSMLPVIFRNATLYQLVCTVFVQVCVNMYVGHANRENMIINKSPLFGL